MAQNPNYFTVQYPSKFASDSEWREIWKLPISVLREECPSPNCWNFCIYQWDKLPAWLQNRILNRSDK